MPNVAWSNDGDYRPRGLSEISIIRRSVYAGRRKLAGINCSGNTRRCRASTRLYETGGIYSLPDTLSHPRHPFAPISSANASRVRFSVVWSPKHEIKTRSVRLLIVNWLFEIERQLSALVRFIFLGWKSNYILLAKSAICFLFINYTVIVMKNLFDPLYFEQRVDHGLCEFSE